MDSGKQREGFASRLGFILVSAGCAVGIGNVWRFPTVTGQNGGGVFVLFYLLFLVLMGVPVLTMELAVGRAQQRGKSLQSAGAERHQVAPARLGVHDRLCAADDVLHHGSRLDAGLLL